MHLSRLSNESDTPKEKESLEDLTKEITSRKEVAKETSAKEKAKETVGTLEVKTTSKAVRKEAKLGIHEKVEKEKERTLLKEEQV